jgi:hypothetical protein
MQKGIGLSRTVKLDWLDAAATLCMENRPPAEISKELHRLIEPSQPGARERRNTVGLINSIWVNGEPNLKREALTLYPQLSSREDRLCLHYGLILAQYPFFRLCAVTLGQLGRIEATVSRKAIRNKVLAELGNLGSIERAISRLFITLIDWGVLLPDEKNQFFKVCLRSIAPSTLELEKWLLACALLAHPSDSLPFADMVGLPELFPFSFVISVDDLRKDPLFEVQRQGGGLEMISNRI